MPTPELILFMSPSQETLAQRIACEGRPSTIVDGLGHKISLYEEWLAERREQVLRLDNTRCSHQALRRLFQRDALC